MTSLIKNPLETLKLAQDYICDFINEFYNLNQAHIRTILIFLLYYLNFSMYSDFLINLNYNIGVCLVWFVLGIMSSIGLGTGFHTGIIFVLPHINNIYQTANSCGHIEFDIYGSNKYQCVNYQNNEVNFGMFTSNVFQRILLGSRTAWRSSHIILLVLPMIKCNLNHILKAPNIV